MAPMPQGQDPRGAIFRPEAWERYLRGRTQNVLLDALNRRLFVSLWVGAGLLLLGGLAILYVRIPVQGSGYLVRAASPSSPPASNAWVLLPALTPEEVSAHPELRLELEGRPLRVPVLGVEPAPLDPETLRARFAAVGGALTVPMVVVATRLEEVGGPEVRPIQVEVPPQRLISWLPFLGHLFSSK